MYSPGKNAERGVSLILWRICDHAYMYATFCHCGFVYTNL